MTLEDIESTLPNGLHDAEVEKISVDHRMRTLTLELSVWVGDMDDPPERREAYRAGRLELSGFQFLVVQPPDPRYPFKDATRLTIDACHMSKNLNSKLLESLPDDAFVRSLWVNEWNAFMHVAAKKAEIVWQGKEILYRPQREHIRPGETIGLQ